MKKSIGIGDLKQIIELQQLTTKVDESGFQVEEWETVLKTRCRVEFDKSYKLNKEVATAEGISTFTARIFTFRYDPRIAVSITKSRILFKGNYYQLQVMNNIDEENRFLMVWGNLICQ